MPSNRRPVLLVTLIVAALLILLAATNPSRADFEGMLSSSVAESSTGLFDRIAGEVVAGFHKRSIVYSNYVFFSVVETHLGANEHRYLGILGNWLLVDSS